MLLSGEVLLDDGEGMSKGFAVAMSLMIGIVLSTYAVTAYRLFKQLIKCNKCAVSITPDGIEDTMVFINLFAYVMVSPVKLIPWEAITYFDSVEGKPYIRVNTKLVQSGWFAKILLFIIGYHFCASFVKPPVQVEDIIPYQHRFSVNDAR